MKAYNSDITIGEFIARHAKPYDAATDNYFRKPFAEALARWLAEETADQQSMFNLLKESHI